MSEAIPKTRFVIVAADRDATWGAVKLQNIVTVEKRGHIVGVMNPLEEHLHNALHVARTHKTSLSSRDVELPPDQNVMRRETLLRLGGSMLAVVSTRDLLLSVPPEAAPFLPEVQVDIRSAVALRQGKGLYEDGVRIYHSTIPENGPDITRASRAQLTLITQDATRLISRGERT